MSLGILCGIKGYPNIVHCMGTHKLIILLLFYWYFKSPQTKTQQYLGSFKQNTTYYVTIWHYFTELTFLIKLLKKNSFQICLTL